MKNKIRVKDKRHLTQLIEIEIELHGQQCDLNHLDVSHITDINCLFSNSLFNGDISQWDVSKVEKMNLLFAYSKFNGDISNWNVSNVKDMSYMFEGSVFNGKLSKWKISKVKNMKGMFNNSVFTEDLIEWEPYSVENFGSMFYNCSAPIPYWAEIMNQKLRIKEIKSYHLAKKLNQELIKNSNRKSFKKIKI